MRPVLEAIVDNADGAREAEAGGADRLEIVRDLDRGGLTPSPATVREIASAVRIPARAMLRESADYRLHGADDLARLRDAAAAFEAAGVAGVVVGFERERRADLDSVAAVLEACPRLPATFHRAFEALADPLAEIARLKSLPRIDRVLTNGGEASWTERAERLEAWRRTMAPEIELLVGGGLDLDSLNLLRASTQAVEFHVGTGARDAFGRVRRELVRLFRQALDRPPVAR